MPVTCSFFSILSVWLTLLSPFHFPPPFPFNQTVSQNQYFLLRAWIRHSLGFLRRNVGLFLCFLLSQYWLDLQLLFRNCRGIRNLLYKHSAGVWYLLLVPEQIHLSVSLRRSRFTIAQQRLIPRGQFCCEFTNSNSLQTTFLLWYLVSSFFLLFEIPSFSCSFSHTPTCTHIHTLAEPCCQTWWIPT